MTEKQQIKTYPRRGKQSFKQSIALICRIQGFRLSFEDNTEVTQAGGGKWRQN